MDPWNARDLRTDHRRLHVASAIAILLGGAFLGVAVSTIFREANAPDPRPSPASTPASHSGAERAGATDRGIGGAGAAGGAAGAAGGAAGGGSGGQASQGGASTLVQDGFAAVARAVMPAVVN